MGTKFIFCLYQSWPLRPVSLLKLNQLFFGLIDQSFPFKTCIVKGESLSESQNLFFRTCNHLISHAHIHISLLIDFFLNTFLGSFKNAIGNQISHFRVSMIYNDICNVTFFSRNDPNPTFSQHHTHNLLGFPFNSII